MGAWGLPGTFPTGAVKRAIQDNVPSQAGEWNRNKVNDLYLLYKDGIQDGMKPYQQGQTGILTWMRSRTNVPDAQVSMFLYTLYTLAQDGRIDQQYWDIQIQEERAILPNIIPDIPGTITKTLSTVKWVSIAAVVLVGGYYALPFFKKMTKSKRRK